VCPKEESCEPSYANQCAFDLTAIAVDNERGLAVKRCRSGRDVAVGDVDCRDWFALVECGAKWADHGAARQLRRLPHWHLPRLCAGAWGAFSHSLATHVDFCQYMGCYTRNLLSPAHRLMFVDDELGA
jgi:hypothetical protein